MNTSNKNGNKEIQNNSKIWFTSDLHFFHANIIKYCKRPFENIEEMNHKLIEGWNEKVNDHDKVYLLGDVAMGGKNKADLVKNYLNKMNGKIYLIKGNHDDYILNGACKDRFEWVKDYYNLNYESPSFGYRSFHLMHYPMLTWPSAGKTNKSGNYTSIMLHGHSHGSLDEMNLSTTRIDVGVDSHHYQPIEIEEIIKIMNSRKYSSVDHHDRDTSY